MRSPGRKLGMARRPQAVRQAVQPEPDFAREFERWLVNFGWDYYHTYDSRRSRPGFPDYVCWRDQRTLFVELKTDVGKSSEEQKDCQAALARNPHVEVYEFRPRDWPEIFKALR